MLSDCSVAFTSSTQSVAVDLRTRGPKSFAHLLLDFCLSLLDARTTSTLVALKQANPRVGSGTYYAKGSTGKWERFLSIILRNS